MFRFLYTAFSFITGLIFYNFDPYTSSGLQNSSNNFMDLSLKYYNNLSQLNRDAFNISKDSSLRGVNLDQSVREKHYEFCTGNRPLSFSCDLILTLLRLDGMTSGCSILTITSMSSGLEKSISDEYYQVNGRDPYEVIYFGY